MTYITNAPPMPPPASIEEDMMYNRDEVRKLGNMKMLVVRWMEMFIFMEFWFVEVRIGCT